MTTLHLDYETFCELDLTKVGLYRYATHESAEILMAAWALDDEVVQHSTNIDDIRRVLLLAKKKGFTVAAFNAPFERIITREVLGIDIPISQWRCVMVHAYHLSFAGTLSQIGEQLGLPAEKQKLTEGRRLIHKFCSLAPRNHKVRRYTAENSPEDWKKFCEYNIQDVVAEREIDMLLSRYPMPDSEQFLWEIDQKINDRGLPIDLALVEKMLKIYHQEKAHLITEMKRITGLDNPNSGPQLHAWLHSQGTFLDNLQAETIDDALNDPLGLPDIVREVLELKSKSARTAGAKWEAYARMTDPVSSRIRGVFQMNGASRTGRWAGRGIQPHNLHRSPPDQDTKIAACQISRDWVRTLYGEDDVMDIVASCVRAGITALEGNKLVVCDLSSIESRYIAWMSQCSRMTKIFLDGKDTYKDFATEMFHCSYEEVTKPQRTIAKPPVLGCGYQLGADGLMKYAKSMGVEMSKEEAKTAVKTFRTVYHEIPQMWDDLVEACKDCIVRGGQYFLYGVRISRDDQFLFIMLPSGRTLYYYQPLVQRRTIVLVDTETGEERSWTTDAVTYMGMNQYTHKWERIATHGGKITENIVQAGARDVFAYGMTFSEQDPLFEINGHTHDEQITTASDASCEMSLQRLSHQMSQIPPWAPGLTMGAEGYIAKRYRKE